MLVGAVQNNFVEHYNQWIAEGRTGEMPERTRNEWVALGATFRDESEYPSFVGTEQEDGTFKWIYTPDAVDVMSEVDLDQFELGCQAYIAAHPDAGYDPHTKIEPIFREELLSPTTIANLVLVGKYNPKDHLEVFEPVKVLTGYKEHKPKSQTAQRTSPLLSLARQEADKIMKDVTSRAEKNLAELNLESEPYPVFPIEIFEGTSLFEGLAKPFCEVNTRYPEYLLLPAVTMMLNYLGTRVRIEMKNIMPTNYMVSIGRKGRVIKSSCVKDAAKYCEQAGFIGQGGGNNANGRALMLTAGSMEGLGMEMNRLNCRNGILVYDELKTLTDKVGIEGSTLGGGLLSMYESAKMQNVVKDPKKCYSLLADSYCVSLIACSTDKNFQKNWSTLAGGSSGLDDRFFLLMQPEVLKPVTPYVHVDTHEGAAKTEALVRKAIEKGSFRILDSSPLNKFLEKHEGANRAEIRIEKFSLYFCVDLGKEDIDLDCISRATKLVEYEMAVKKYIPRFESENKQAQLQQSMMVVIHRGEKDFSSGVITIRAFDNNMNRWRYGTTDWDRAYNGLINSGWAVVVGAGVKGDPKRLVQQQPLPNNDE